MNRFAKQQEGLTLITILVILAVVGFFVLLILKIGPIYLENMKVKDSLASLEAESELVAKNRAQLMDLVEKRLDVNMVTHVTQEDISIIKTSGYVSVEIDYEVTENIFANLDVLVYFNDKIEAGSR